MKRCQRFQKLSPKALPKAAMGLAIGLFVAGSAGATPSATPSAVNLSPIGAPALLAPALQTPQDVEKAKQEQEAAKKKELEKEIARKKEIVRKQEEAERRAEQEAEYHRKQAEAEARKRQEASPQKKTGDKPASKEDQNKRKGIGRPPKTGGAPPAKRIGSRGQTPVDQRGLKDPRLQQKDQERARRAEQAQREKQLMTQSDPGAKLAIEFGTERHDFGRLRQGDKVEHTFSMQAGGTTPLKIRQIKPSCGCTLGSVQVSDAEGAFHEYTFGDPIEPGREIKVNAAVDTTNKRNKVQVRIQVMSNDPAGIHALTITAEVQPFLMVTPQVINFGDVPMGGQRSQVVDVRSTRGEPIALTVDETRLRAMPKGMTYSMEPVNPNGEGKSAHWQLRVNLTPEAQEGPANMSFRMVSDVQMPVDPKKEAAAKERGSHVVPQFFFTQVSVSGKILGAFSVDRTYLSFGLVRPGQVVPRSVRLTCNEEAYNLDKIQVSMRGRGGKTFDHGDLFETSIKPVPSANAIDVELRLKGFPDGSDVSFSGDLVISTGYPDSPEKVVGFTGICRSEVPQRGSIQKPGQKPRGNAPQKKPVQKPVQKPVSKTPN